MQILRCLCLTLPLLSASSLLLAEAAATPPVQLLQCPPPSNLVRDAKTLLWQSKRGDWKSFAPSFSEHVKTFLGAQWQGINVGNIFCLYQGDAMTFTLSLQYYALAREPNTGKWGPNVKGIRNCYANDPQSCAFTPARSKKTLDINQEINELKTNIPSTDQP